MCRRAGLDERTPQAADCRVGLSTLGKRSEVDMSSDYSQSKSPWVLISENPKFDCQYFTARADLVSHSRKTPRPYNHFRMKYDGVYVVPVDRDGYTTLIGQHRFVLQRFTWEVPAGGYRAVLA